MVLEECFKPHESLRFNEPDEIYYYYEERRLYYPIAPVNLNEKCLAVIFEAVKEGLRLDAVKLENNKLYMLNHDFENKHRLRTVYDVNEDVVRREGFDYVNPSSVFIGLVRTFLSGNFLSGKYYDRYRLNEIYEDDISRYKGINQEDLRERIKNIQVHQLSLESFQKEYGVEAKLAKKDKPETWVKAKDLYWLRVGTLLCGGNAVVEYQPGSSIGTPVIAENK